MSRETKEKVRDHFEEEGEDEEERKKSNEE